jgi:hypothetical protein
VFLVAGEDVATGATEEPDYAGGDGNDWFELRSLAGRGGKDEEDDESCGEAGASPIEDEAETGGHDAAL